MSFLQSPSSIHERIVLSPMYLSAHHMHLWDGPNPKLSSETTSCTRARPVEALESPCWTSLPLTTVSTRVWSTRDAKMMPTQQLRRLPAQCPPRWLRSPRAARSRPGRRAGPVRGPGAVARPAASARRPARRGVARRAVPRRWREGDQRRRLQRQQRQLQTVSEKLVMLGLGP